MYISIKYLTCSASVDLNLVYIAIGRIGSLPDFNTKLGRFGRHILLKSKSTPERYHSLINGEVSVQGVACTDGAGDFV